MTEKLWVEKYRPDALDEIVGHDAVVARMQRFLEDEAMPNLLFAGRQGIGKTAIVHAFAAEKYGDDWKRWVLELNASDERGIDVVRDRIKEYARQGTGGHDFKLVFLDEADQLTKDAQPALRRTMEDFSDSTRFILSCNYVGQIIDPIQSRCAAFRLTALSDEQVEYVLQRVIDGEGLEVEDEALEHLVREARGDARNAIHTLHACVLDGELTVEDTEDILGTVDYDLVREIVEQAVSGEFEEAITSLDQDILKQGVALDSVVEKILSVIKRQDYDELARARAIDALGEADFRVREGANPHVQLHSLLANLLVAKHSSTGGYSDE